MSVFTLTKSQTDPKVHFTEYLASEEAEETKPADAPAKDASPQDKPAQAAQLTAA